MIKTKAGGNGSHEDELSFFSSILFKAAKEAGNSPTRSLDKNSGEQDARLSDDGAASSQSNTPTKQSPTSTLHIDGGVDAEPHTKQPSLAYSSLGRGRRRGAKRSVRTNPMEYTESILPASPPRRKRARQHHSNPSVVSRGKKTTTTSGGVASSSSSSSATKKKKKKAASNDSIPSTKSAVRLFALSLMFGQWLPEKKPALLTPQDWAVLKALHAKGMLVRIISINPTESNITVRLPSCFDCMIHSRANYSSSFSHWKPNNKTRFRFWSDWNGVQGCFAPVFNRNCAFGSTSTTQLALGDAQIEQALADLDFIERTIFAFPLASAASQYFVYLNQTQPAHDANSIMSHQLGSFFEKFFERYLHHVDRDLLDHEGFGRTRKKPTVYIDDADWDWTPSKALESVKREFSAKWSQR